MKELSQGQVDYLIQMPYTINIPSLQAIVVHAGLIPGLPLEEMNPFNLVTLRNLTAQDNQLIPSKEAKAGQPWSMLWSGPEHVYFGHDSKRMLQKLPYATG
jgi:hypothetical protein